ncbi:MAG: class II aldolase/adducin family protein [Thermomicrobium sp.]|nr:class II aldolase/adducin family protein [Thermomicrobium sp.]MDW8059765.1 class II aldolase/adducin family protein [Thermomicrobium sp.]
MGDSRELVALGCRVLALEGQDDYIWGHVSARDPEGRGVWMKASGLGFEEITPADVLLVGWDGSVLAGSGRQHSEYPIHTELMRARPDIGAVVHTHPVHALAFASLGVPLRPISHEAVMFVPPDVPRFALTGDLITTPELGQALAAALGDRPAIFLVDHGIVTVGPDVPTAVFRALLLEHACRKQLLAMAAGGPRVWSSDEEALAKREHCYSPAQVRAAWELLLRRVRRRWPDV